MTRDAGDVDRMLAALLPLRSALRRRALEEADRLRAEAETEACAVLDHARAHVAATVTEARVQGRQEALVAAESARAAARSRGRGLVLAARRRLYEELRRRVRAEAPGLIAPGWQQLAADAARTMLGPEVRVECDPGAVTATTHDRRLTWSLDAVADRAVEALGSGVERLWTP